MERYILIDTLKEHALELANFPEAQDDNELVQIAVKKNGLALEYASDRLRDDFDTVMLAVKKNGLSLEFASYTLKRNEKIIDAAIKSNGAALQFVPQDLRNNRKLILQAAPNCNIEDIPEQFLADEEIAEILIDSDPAAFSYLPDELRKNTNFIIQAARKDGSIFMYVPDETLENKAIVLKISAEISGVLQFVSEELTNDKEVALTAMKAPGSPYGYDALSSKLKTDADVVRTLIQHIRYGSDDECDFCHFFNVYNIPKQLLSDNVLIRKVVEIYECDDIVPDFSKDFALRAIELGICNTDLLSDELMDDPDIQEALSKIECYKDEDEDEENW